MGEKEKDLGVSVDSRSRPRRRYKAQGGGSGTKRSNARPGLSLFWVFLGVFPCWCPF